MIIAHLPRDSATIREILGEQASWETGDFLLASVIDLLAGANWQRGGGKGARPDPVRRPKSAQQVKEAQERHAAHKARIEAKRAARKRRKEERGN